MAQDQKKDISFIMQSYLGDYPGSRANSDKKFIRAVKSFLAMEDSATELIIVSDGCEITHRLYHELWKDNDQIKYAYVAKRGLKMYEKNELGDKYYRGLPRQVGRELCNSALTTYMDSDDYLLPNASHIIKKWWGHYLVNEKESNWMWANTRAWYDNIDVDYKADQKNSLAVKVLADIENPIEIEGLDSMWIKRSIDTDNATLFSTWSIIHRSDCKSKWIDTTIRQHGNSEDVIFCRKVSTEGQGFSIPEPYYVRCHYHGQWDY